MSPWGRRLSFSTVALRSSDMASIAFLSVFITSFNALNLRNAISADFGIGIIPYGKEVSVAILAAVIFLTGRRILRLKSFFSIISRPLFILVSFLAIDYLQSKIFGRAGSQLSMFPVFIFLGFYFSLLLPSYCSYLVLFYSWATISLSVLLFSLLPEVFVRLGILSDHFLATSRPGFGLARNAGILLNNNAFGSIYTILTICAHNAFRLVNFKNDLVWRFIFLGLLASVFAGNATSFLLIFSYSLLLSVPRILRTSASNVIILIFFTLFLLVTIYFAVGLDYAVYKFYNSGLVKLGLLIKNISEILDGFGFFFGHPSRNFWSESSVINAFYEVGFFQFFLFWLFLFSFFIRVSHAGIVVSLFLFRGTGAPFIFLFLLGILQNSTFMIPAAMAYGLCQGVFSKAITIPSRADMTT